MKKLIIFVSILIAGTSINAQTKVGDAYLSNLMAAGKDKLTINGAGMREKYFMDMYACGLYLKAKSKDATTIVNADEAMAMKLHIVSSLITAQKMEDAVQDGFQRATNGNSAPYKDKIEQFKSVFKEQIKVNDEYDIVYIPGEGTVVSKNGVKKVAIPGHDFKKIVFSLWLGPKPADEDLKKSLLGS